MYYGRFCVQNESRMQLYNKVICEWCLQVFILTDDHTTITETIAKLGIIMSLYISDIYSNYYVVFMGPGSATVLQATSV